MKLYLKVNNLEPFMAYNIVFNIARIHSSYLPGLEDRRTNVNWALEYLCKFGNTIKLKPGSPK